MACWWTAACWSAEREAEVCSIAGKVPQPPVFQADAVENGPNGLRAREALMIRSHDELESRFDLASDTREFTSYTVERLHRQP